MDLTEKNKDELMALAQDLDIAGRSSMDKPALLKAVTKAMKTQAAADAEVAADAADAADLADEVDEDLPVDENVAAEPVVPLQVYGAEDRLGGAPPEAPEGFHHTGVLDPAAKVADSVIVRPSEAPFDNYVPPKRPIAVTEIAHYPATNTV